MLLNGARDPAARGRGLWLLLALILLWPLLHLARFDPLALFDSRNLALMGGFLAGFLPPATGMDFLRELARATLETVAIASAGLALAFVLALPLALGSSRSLSPSAIGPGPGRRRAAVLRAAVRLLMTVLRGIPELVWALLFVRIFGLGPAAGVLALGLTYGGMLAKVYGEILESGDPRPARALLESGAGRLAALGYGLLPGVAPELVSYTVYRWECALRASVVMGFVGAGGLGQLMDQAMKMLNGGEAATILLTFLLLVLLADGLSSFLRGRVMEAGNRSLPLAFGLPALALVAGLLAAVAASCVYLDLGFAALLTREAALQAGDFARAFWPPDGSPDWLAKVAWGSLETLAISLVGTLLAALAGVFLALPAAGWLGPWAARSCRLLLNGLRSVPELVWATLMALAVGLGAFAGTLALALHTAGVLGRLFAESLENASPEPARALEEAGASSLAAFLYGTLPAVFPQFLAYSLYRWEMNIRMAAILGFVGAGGLGQLLYVELSLFHQSQAATVIFAMLALSVAVDGASASLRRRLG